MNTLIVKLGATGDVVRTTPLLRRLPGQITWLSAARNSSLLRNLRDNLRCVPWDERDSLRSLCFDLVINLEDDFETNFFLQGVKARQWFGAFLNSSGLPCYTEDSRAWFDLSLISKYGRVEADKLKLQNRRTYQELIYDGLGLFFNGDTYLLPDAPETGLAGDIAIATEAGLVWPMKNWAFYDDLKEELEARGLLVNLLPRRPTLLEHLADVRGHRCLVSGDSLPMHLALGAGRKCVSLFTCTSPWEIYDYGLQKKIVSPLLDEFFYKRDFDPRAVTAIGLDQVLEAVLAQVRLPVLAVA